MNDVKQILSAKVPKAFWIPSKNRFISAGQMVKIYKFCKANPGVEVKETIKGWWPGTTDEVLNQIRERYSRNNLFKRFFKLIKI